MPSIQKVKDFNLLEKMLTSAELHLERLKREDCHSESKISFLEDCVKEVRTRLQELKDDSKNNLDEQTKKIATH